VAVVVVVPGLRSIVGKVGRRESGWDSVLEPGSGTRISIDYNHALYIFIYNNVAVTPGFSSGRKSNNNAGGIALSYSRLFANVV